MTMNTNLLPRPFSNHSPKVSGFEPLIKAEIVRVNKRRKNSWRCQIIVGGSIMFISHHDLNQIAEEKAEKMLGTYTNMHYWEK